MKRLDRIGRRAATSGALALIPGVTALAVVLAANAGDPLRAVAVTPASATAAVQRLVASSLRCWAPPRVAPRGGEA